MEIVARHRAEQQLIARNTIAELHLLWGLLDFYNLQETTAPWLRAVRPVIERGYLTSQYVAARFYREYRQASLPDAEPMELDVPNPLGVFGIPVIPDRATQVRVMVSMKVTGPVWLMQNTTPEVAKSEQLTQELLQRGFSKSSGAATRLVLNGGRGLVVTAAQADPRARGVRSVLSEGSECEDCTLLASLTITKDMGERKMGAVAVGHDFCRCSAMPVW